MANHCKRIFKFFLLTPYIICLGKMLCVNELNGFQQSDFNYSEKSISRIAFGSCMNGMFSGLKWHQQPQPIWKQILQQNPDLWIWLGDAVYGDTRVLPLVWTPSPLALMAKYYRRQKNHPDYQEFLKSNISILGVWDDHDFGMNDGGINFWNRLQTQDLYFDFLDEPLNSIRRQREGLYVSYIFGNGNKAVKIIMLDVRSFAVHGKECDILGDKQWQWLEKQMSDPTPVALTIVTSGIQILSNAMRGLQNWEDCPHSYDRLIWLTRRRGKSIFLSGDVHFGETSCLNSSSSGYPLYELTSSGLYLSCTVPILNDDQCAWSIRNAIGNDFRITEPVVERNFGLIEIDWNTSPVEIKLLIYGKNAQIVSKVVIDLDHIKKKLLRIVVLM
ncbi:uncharacterized protein LOC124439979 isoform X2 [Xenia sp. Carnegie-2017]|uniref:uncharacterized protein LOC124439979 isoform X2 n=1 Tax=Xenia sp. Carnegie-2017 TaxID=2897299 RepID=UPI001F0333E4|nr:uncharacterized protein LOC124439979 isoform X2 [Xenia sp. Carnegie-2017]